MITKTKSNTETPIISTGMHFLAALGTVVPSSSSFGGLPLAERDHTLGSKIGTQKDKGRMIDSSSQDPSSFKKTYIFRLLALFFPSSSLSSSSMSMVSSSTTSESDPSI